MIKSSLFMLLFVLIPTFGLAQNLAPLDFRIHQQFVTTRALGMGNAFVGLADDYSAVMYNPAGLSFLDDWELNLNIQAAAEPKVLDFYKDVDDASKAADEETAIGDVIEKNYGKHYALRLPTVSAIYARPGWGLAFIPVDTSVDLNMNQQVGPTVNAIAYLDTSLVLGLSKDLKKHVDSGSKWSIGASLKAIHRGYFSDSVSATELLANDNDPVDFDKAQEGFTVDIDLGTLYKPKVPQKGFFSFLKYAEPSFGFVVRNAIDYGFTTNFHVLNDDSVGEPPKLQRRFDVGTAWKLPNFWVFKPRMVADIRDMGHRNFAFVKGTHLGFELQWIVGKYLKGAYRFGLNQGYLTAGITAKLLWFQLEGATYGDELGTSKAKKEVRNYMVSLSTYF